MLTINGAQIQPDKMDIVVPQGIAHAIDRVMFPLPVGDILQTLQSDREGKFNRFLKVVQDSGVASMITGWKSQVTVYKYFCSKQMYVATKECVC